MYQNLYMYIYRCYIYIHIDMVVHVYKYIHKEREGVPHLDLNMVGNLNIHKTTSKFLHLHITNSL